MRRHLITASLLPLLILAPCLVIADDLPSSPEQSQSSFLKTYCFQCHSGDEPEADRRFDDLSTLKLTPQKSSPDHIEHWTEILHQLQLEEMPPSDAKQPSPEERQTFIDQLERQLIDASSDDSTPSEVIHRRLNRHEYLHTIQDLFGFRDGDFDPTTPFPADEETDGLRTDGEALRTSGYLIEQYFAAADQVLEHAYDLARVNGDPQPQTWVGDADTIKNISVHTGIGLIETDHRRIYISQGLRSHESDYKAKLFIDPLETGVPHSGFYEVDVDVTGFSRRHPYGDDLMPDYLKKIYPDPLLFFDPDRPLQIAIGQERFRQLSELRRIPPTFLAVSDVPDDVEQTIHFKIWIDRGNAPFLGFANGPAEGTKMQFVTNKLYKYDPEVPRIDPKVWANLTLRYERNRLYNHKYRGPELHVSQVRVHGPLPQEQPSLARSLMFHEISPVYEISTEAVEIPSATISASLRHFASRLFRRPVLDSEIEPHVRLIQTRLSSGLNYSEAALPVFKALLCSPHFLFLVEPDEARQPLDAWQLAARLAIFLRSASPDEELLAAAEKGYLLHPDELAKQTRRLIDSPDSLRFSQHFTEQWLGLNRLGSMAPGMEEFPDYYLLRLEPAMKRETALFFHELLRENKPITTLVDADFTYANAGLAHLYGIDFHGTDSSTSDEFVRVSLPADSRRHGLLGQASILTVTSNGVETSPVIRGVWLLKSLFGTPPRPPPPDVPPLEPDIRGATTIREQLAKHRSVSACNSCHQKIDPLGFALEPFDPIGRLRTAYPGNLPIDSTAEYKGIPLHGPAGISDYLVSHRQLLLRNLTRKLLAYAIGRKLHPADQPEVDRIIQAWERQGTGMADLVLLITQSQPFRTK